MHEYLISLCSAYELHRFTLQCLEHGNTVEIHNGIMFDFYMGLPHMIYILIGNFCYEPNCNAKGELVLGAVGSVSCLCLVHAVTAGKVHRKSQYLMAVQLVNHIHLALNVA